MKFKIHYEVDGVSDEVILEGDTIEDIRTKAKQFRESRGLEAEKNNMWSEETKLIISNE